MGWVWMGWDQSTPMKVIVVHFLSGGRPERGPTKILKDEGSSPFISSLHVTLLPCCRPVPHKQSKANTHLLFTFIYHHSVIYRLLSAEAR